MGEPGRAPVSLDEQSTWNSATTGAAPADAVAGYPADIFRRGEIVDSVYEIRALLGSGGMGQVYEAFDHHLVRPVAVKASWPWVPSRFLRCEARALAGVRHPGVVSVHAAGVHCGVEYLVMERLYGVTLGEQLRRRAGAGEVAVADALDILIGIGDALDAIHRSGLVHRDLKPDNIMLAPDSRVILLDLGVCQSPREIVSDDGLRGSPHYLAPETITGHVDPAQAHKVDIYALGVIAFELLAGRPPLDDPDPMKLLHKHVTDAPPRLADAAPAMPEQLDRLVAAMLSKDPAERPGALESLVTSLRAIRGASRREHQARLSRAG